MTPATPRDTMPVHVLLIEHDRDDAKLAVDELRRAGIEVRAEVIGTRSELAALSPERPYDIVLADYQLGDWTGIDALAELRSRGWDTPLILVTGRMGEEQAVECLKQGAADYVPKQNLARLPVAVRRAMEEKRVRDERARTDDLLRKLTLAVDQSPASVIITDTRGTIEYVNRRFTEATGYEPTEAVGQNPRILKSGKTPTAAYHDLWSTIKSGGVWHGEVRNRRRSGELYWDRVTIAPVRDASGTVTHFLATQEDVTEHLRAKHALEDAEARLRKLTEASFGGIAIAIEGQVSEVNRGFAEMFGYSLEEVVGRSLLDFIAPESVAEVRRRMTDGIEGTYEIVGLRRDGKKVLIEATVRNHTVDGRPARIAALRDLTERRQLEEQFRQAQKMEAVGRLAGGVAHDFNNQLTVIMSYTGMLLEQLGDDDPRREDLEEVKRAATSAASLTRQLLAFSRQQVVQPKLIFPDETLGSAEKMLRRLIGEDIELITTLRAESTPVFMDPVQLEQVLLNLAVNARDAMPDGGRLLIETSVVELDEESGGSHWPAMRGRFVLMAVSDTGMGMDDATKARIFEPFFTTKELGKGTGLGLATVYGIVKQAGGFIWVYSEPGRGATFKTYLPVAPSEAALNTPSSVAVQPGELRGSETILLVEDEASVRKLAGDVLARHGYEVLVARGAQEALAIAARHHGTIHLVLTDVVMPGMNGRELVERLAAIRKDVRALYMSGYTRDTIAHHGALVAGLAFLEKPFTANRLLMRVREVISEPR